MERDWNQVNFHYMQSTFFLLGIDYYFSKLVINTFALLEKDQYFSKLVIIDYHTWVISKTFNYLHFKFGILKGIYLHQNIISKDLGCLKKSRKPFIYLPSCKSKYELTSEDLVLSYNTIHDTGRVYVKIIYSSKSSIMRKAWIGMITNARKTFVYLDVVLHYTSKCCTGVTRKKVNSQDTLKNIMY